MEEVTAGTSPLPAAQDRIVPSPSGLYAELDILYSVFHIKCIPAFKSACFCVLQKKGQNSAAKSRYLERRPMVMDEILNNSAVKQEK